MTGKALKGFNAFLGGQKMYAVVLGFEEKIERELKELVKKMWNYLKNIRWVNIIMKKIIGFLIVRC